MESRPKVYLETTIISYLAPKPSRDTIAAAPSAADPVLMGTATVAV
jgi:hypothetical protein